MVRKIYFSKLNYTKIDFHNIFSYCLNGYVMNLKNMYLYDIQQLHTTATLTVYGCKMKAFQYSILLALNTAQFKSRLRNFL